MIFVTVGTNEAPFDRLLKAIDGIDLEERVVIQCGASAIRPARAECVEFLPFDALVGHIRDARVVVTHAGVGSVAVALANGKRPVVVPRLARFEEAVDDHQIAFAHRFAAGGHVHLVEDLADLSSALETDSEAVTRDSVTGALALELRAYIHEVVAKRRPRPLADPR